MLCQIYKPPLAVIQQLRVSLQQHDRTRVRTSGTCRSSTRGMREQESGFGHVLLLLNNSIINQRQLLKYMPFVATSVIPRHM